MRLFSVENLSDINGVIQNFDLTINSDFGIEEVADIIVALYKKGEHKNK